VTDRNVSEAGSGAGAGAHAVVLLSGGLDSATCLAIARDEGFVCHALSFDYGQRHALELDAARGLARAAGVEHVVATIDLGIFGGSALTADIAVPKHDAVDELDDDVIPITYVPARNTIFLSYALALAEVRGARDIFIGVNALDYSGYPDCRPEYIAAFGAMANLATRSAVAPGDEPDGARPVRIRTPLISMTKAEIIRMGAGLGVDHGATTSCYDPVPAAHGDGPAGAGPVACGHCDACLLRRKGFAEAGLVDPIPYADGRHAGSGDGSGTR
jgi:7-cyano-7-deazaguanine synthase